ncbi:TniQ family protein [uncultured Parvibaculum sp.]|uniref:TniQ family protein n=1 Tax=uncultured Parvibaculum sp. TaxID=291828 RepID=UPI0030DD8DEB|tara:strand:+ start:28000 stop:28962 length:963 start_codon:yes stop_codon:yes gene_type:complete
MSNLLFRLEPIRDESLLSFVARTADANLLRPGDMARLAGVSADAVLPLLLGNYDSQHLAQLLGCAREEVEYRRYLSTSDGQHSFFGVAVDRDHLCPTSRRFAPRALSRSAFHRAHWDISFIFTDRDTGELLQSLCPECGTEQTWRSGSLVECRECGFDIRNAPEQATPAALKDLDVFLHGIVDPSAEVREKTRDYLSPPLRSSGVTCLIEIMTLMGGLMLKHRPDKALCIQNLILDRQIEMMMNGHRLLPDWPSSATLLIEKELSQFAKGRQKEALTFAAAVAFANRAQSKEAQTLLVELIFRFLMKTNAAGNPGQPAIR